ncbi:hypothetical protein [Cellulomonas hominis]|uniref:hypothetical protein n=1 Tax=Cellulomonas hominis TaxID=156981 RepID=UPI001BCF2657|nr:hypothetical protein [Cellulomonas hominis]
MSYPDLRIADLRTALGLALDAFEEERGSEVAIEHDHYWHLAVDASFDLSREPTRLSVGQVSDDLAEIRSLVATGDASPAWHAISHVIGLLRVVEDAARP